MLKHLKKLLVKKEPEVSNPIKLSKAEKKKIRQIQEQVGKKNKVPHTAQESLSFVKMYPSGICKVTENFYSKTIQFEDSNYLYWIRMIRRNFLKSGAPSLIFSTVLSGLSFPL